jgi:formate dehydrogenase (hydrogenase)
MIRTAFLIIGSNTSEGHPLIATRILKAKKRGAKIIVLDPSKNQIGHWADIYHSFPRHRCSRSSTA